ncbi:hypothetical protein ScPMuIL_017670 [Solemya velum]
MQDTSRLDRYNQSMVVEHDIGATHLETFRERDGEIPAINVNCQPNYRDRERLTECVSPTRNENYGNREGVVDSELLDVVLQTKEDNLKSESSSRFSGLSPRANGTLSRPMSYISKRSINLSTERLSEAQETVSEKSSSDIISKTMFNLALLSLSSLAICIIAVQILLSMSQYRSDFTPSTRSLLNTSESYEDILEIAVAMSTFVIVLDLSCVLVASLQCVFALQILRLSDGEERTLKYLRECSSSRYVVVFGFFLSLPTLFVAFILYMLMRFRSTTAIIATVTLAAGILFSALSILQNVCQWQVEKGRADAGLPVYDAPSVKTFEPDVHRNELSTLV